MIYNFRFARDHRDEILSRLLEKSTLSQGWGGGDTNLDLRQDDFVDRAVERYGMDTTHIPSNLERICDFEDGDLLVTPHLPENNTVSIHEVEGDFPECYTYLESDETNQNHRIDIRESWGLEGNISVKTWQLASWKAKLPWLRYPVLPIEQFEPQFREIIGRLRENPDAEFGESDLEEYFQDLRERVLEDLQEALDLISPSGASISFESVCKRLLRSAGYEVDRKHKYDGEGGDVDFVLNRAKVSPFETEETTLFVQVKKHSGETGANAVRQVLDMMRKEPDAGGCVISLADGFTEDAEEIAVNNGVGLINGETVCRLLIEDLFGPTT